VTDAAQEPESRPAMDSPEAAAPRSVAVIGSGRSSRFYRECLTLDSRFEVMSQSDELPSDADLSSLAAVFLFDAPETRRASISQCLASDCRVVTESPIAATAEVGDELAALDGSGSESSRPFILRRGFENPDFRRAWEVVSDGEAGDVRHVEFTLQQTAAFFLPEDPDAPDPANSSAPAELKFGVLPAFGPDLLAQTLTLIPQQVVRLFATRSFRRPEFGPVDSPPGESRLAVRSADVDSGFRVWLEFETGETAQLTVDLASHADVTTGWTLQTTRGGYRKSRKVLTEADGEIYDVPVDAGDSSLLDAVAAFLAGSDRDGAAAGDRLRRLFSLQTELRVLKLLEAVRESAATRQTVACRI
jgi:predicted dehydrogenase